ncbi:hypothetical protein [Paenibacillus herberti]|uniref:Uncharacterized protein n=1 Tax=Paenibacillus herberti TaxID=1619309 RepID=A0A229NYC9_9BACL|nr:hypothetical protein [Paenibacillus herberti]OXM14902.1 hypothetical protein CGZ75_18740 [Paenibacillus herberti]
MHKSPMLLLSLFLIIFVSACSNFSDEPIPSPTASIENSSTTIPVEVVSYNWGLKETYGSPWELLENKTAVTVQKKSKIILSFDKKPEKILFHQNLSYDDFIKLDILSNEIIVPDKKGIYIYSFIATWPKGTVHYSIKVKVE